MSDVCAPCSGYSFIIMQIETFLFLLVIYYGIARIPNPTCNRRDATRYAKKTNKYFVYNYFVLLSTIVAAASCLNSNICIFLQDFFFHFDLFIFVWCLFDILYFITFTSYHTQLTIAIALHSRDFSQTKSDSEAKKREIPRQRQLTEDVSANLIRKTLRPLECVWIWASSEVYIRTTVGSYHTHTYTGPRTTHTHIRFAMILICVRYIMSTTSPGHSHISIKFISIFWTKCVPSVASPHAHTHSLVMMTQWW